MQPSPIVVRSLGAASVLIALAGVIAIFTTGSSGSSTTHSRPPVVAPSPSGRPSPSPSAGHATRSPAAHPTASTSASAATGTHGSSHPAAGGSAPAAAPTKTLPASSSSGHPHQSHRRPIVLPATGVYDYATQGYEQTSIPGTRRTFPSTTHVTIRRVNCGFSSTWAPVSQHRETMTFCVHGHKLVLASDETQISYFGVSNDETIKCSSGAYVYSTRLRPGQTWSFTCGSVNGHATQHLTAVGYDRIRVGGTRVRTLHIRVQSSVSGAETGSLQQDLWYSPKLGTIVRNTGSTNAKQGGVSYRANYSMTLQHTTPS